jgi:hypothetical protein
LVVTKLPTTFCLLLLFGVALARGVQRVAAHNPLPLNKLLSGEPIRLVGVGRSMPRPPTGRQLEIDIDPHYTPLLKICDPSA